MPNFQLDPTGYDIRPMKEGDSGWDVFALQTGLNEYADPAIVEDGFFGPRTTTAVRRFQKNRELDADGIAGGLTQRSIASGIAPEITEKFVLPRNQLKGTLESESGFYLGNHTRQYADGSWDLGVAQLNDKHKGVTFGEAFDVKFAINELGRTIRANFNTYAKQSDGKTARLQQRGLDKPDRKRLWNLAAGSWNRPAYTAWLAGEIDANSAKPNDEQLAWIEAYMSRVCAYSNATYAGKEWPS